MYKKFFRRFLPFLLSVAMMAEMIPATAFAAEAPVAEEVLTEETVVEEADTDEAVPEIAAESADADEGEETPAVSPIPDKWYTQIKVFDGSKEVNLSEEQIKVYSETSTLAESVGEWTYRIYVDGKPQTGYEGLLKKVWKDQDGKTIADSATGAVGSYTYAVSVGAVDNFCTACDIEVNCRVIKRTLTVKESEVGGMSAAPGSTVAEFIEKAKEKITSLTYGSDTYAISAYAEPISVTVSEYEIKEGKETVTPITDGSTRFNAEKEYVYSIDTELKGDYGKNYELDKSNLNGRKLSVNKATEVKLEVALKNAAAKLPSVVYKETEKGEAVAIVMADAVDGYIDLEKTRVTYADSDAAGGRSEIADPDAAYDKLVKVWKDINGTELGVDAEEKPILPAQAGTYVLELQYQPGKDWIGIYQASNVVELQFVIDPAPVTVVPKPVDDPPKAFLKNQKDRDVLNKFTYQILNQDGKEVKNNGTFWGVSYDDTLKKQAYEPKFKVERVKLDPETGKPVTVDGKEDGELVYENNNNAPLETGRSYRVIFTGMKAIYNPSGYQDDPDVPITELSVNGADKNHIALVDSKTLKDTAVTFTVEDGIETNIDVSAILKGILKEDVDAAGAGESFENPIVRIYNGTSIYYDGIGLYGSRSEYKKAVVNAVIEGKEQQLTKDADQRILYSWEKYVDSDTVTDPKDPTKEITIHNWTGYLEYQKAPAVPQTYRLLIEFEDPTCKYLPCRKEVYYQIQPQFVSVRIKDKPAGDGKAGEDGEEPAPAEKVPTGYYGHSIEEYLVNIDLKFDYGYGIYKLVDNEYDLADLYKATDPEIFKDDYRRNNITWTVERRKKNEKGEFTDEYEADYTEFAEGEEYRLIGYFNDYYAHNGYSEGIDRFVDHHDYEVAGAVKTIYFDKPETIPLDAMGNTEIEIAIDADKIAPRYKVYDGRAYDLNVADIATVRDAKSGRELTDKEFDKEKLLYAEWIYKTFTGETLTSKYAAVNAGTYDLKVRFDGNNRYMEAESGTAPAVLVIGQREVTITPQIKDGDVVGGTKISPASDYAPASAWKVTGLTGVPGMPDVISDDVNAFTYGYVGEDGKFVGDFRAFVYNTTSKTSVTTDLMKLRAYEDSKPTTVLTGDARYRSNTAYTAKCGEIQSGKKLAVPYCYNYKILYGSASFTTGLGVSEVNRYTLANPNTIVYPVRETVSVKNSETEKTAVHTVYACDALPYIETPQDTDGDPLKDRNNNLMKEGNYFYFNIRAPWEYDANGDGNFNNDTIKFDYICRNSLEDDINKAGGFIYSYSAADGNITVGFRVQEKARDASFVIRWEENRTETFTVKLSEASLKPNLKAAVAPKSIAFNSPAKKMAVGEVQLLDVKVKKNQVNDIVSLRYKIAEKNSPYLSVTDTGIVTALKAGGSATVVAYAVKKVDGELVEFDKPTTTVKIAVTDVTAPKIKKVTSQNKDSGLKTYNDITVKYTYTDGYRREFYVMAGKKTETDFKNAIENMKDNDYVAAGFAAAPSYRDGGWNSKEKVYEKNLQVPYVPNGGLDYTVYVRAVSGERELADGSVVTKSEKGNVKAFKVTKENMHGLNLYFTGYEFEYTYGNSSGNHWIPLSEGKIATKAEGLFYDISDPDKAADYEHPSVDGPYSDQRWKELPLKGSDARNYVNPKLSYYAVYKPSGSSISDWRQLSYNGYGVTTDPADVKEARDKGYTLKIGNRYFMPARIAKVDRSGLVKLLGAGEVYIIVYDSLTEKADYEVLNIYEVPAAVDIKAPKVKVGQKINLKDCLTYKNGKGGRILTETRFIETHLRPAYPTFQKEDRSDDCTLSGADFTPAKAGGSYKIKLTDYGIKAKEGTFFEKTFTIGASAIDPVKALKVSEIMDKKAVVSFTYTTPIDAKVPGAPNNTEDHLFFQIQVKDSRGSVVYSEVVEGTKTPTKTIYSKGNAVTKYYELPISGLTRKSPYKVFVTACYKGETSKQMQKGFRTTDIPLSYKDLPKYNENNTGTYNTGVEIYAETLSHSDLANGNPTTLGWNPSYFTSGNVYSLYAKVSSHGAGVSTDEINIDAITRATDTLIWKSTNTKVATVSSKGGVAATLQAVKNGTTMIEISSRLTKKVIGRWMVYVKTVGQAQDFHGDIENEVVRWDPSYMDGVAVLTLENSVTVTPAEGYSKYKWVSFTAAKLGLYQFTDDQDGTITWVRDGIDGKYLTATDSNEYVLEAGRKVYFKIENASSDDDHVITASGSTFAASSFASGSGLIEVNFGTGASRNIVVFEALEDNYYIFSCEGNSGFLNNAYKDETLSSGKRYSVDPDVNDDGTTDDYGIGLHKGDLVYMDVDSGSYTIKVESREFKPMKETEATETVTAEKEAWFNYTALATGSYEIKITSTAADNVEVDYYSDVTGKTRTSVWAGTEDGTTKTFTQNVTLTKDQTVAVKVTTKAESASVKIQVTPGKTDRIDPGTKKTVDVKAGKTTWAACEITKAGYYNILTSSDKAFTVNCYKNGTAGGNKLSDTSGVNLKKGDIIYVELTAAEDTSVSVEVKETAAETLKEGTEEKPELVNGSIFWYTFTADEPGLYTFTSSTTGEGPTAAIMQYSKPYAATGGVSVPASQYLKAGATIALKVYAANTVASSTAKTTVTFKLSKVPVEDISKAYDLAEGKEAYYSYTVPEKGKYIFQYTGDATVTNGTDLSSLTDWTGTMIGLKAGQIVYFKVTAAAAAKGTITVTLPLKSAKDYTGAAVTVNKDEEVWIQYLVKEDARYNVSVTKGDPTLDADVICSKELGAATGDQVEAIKAEGNYWTAGTMIYFLLKTSKDPSSSITVKVDKATPTKLDKDKDNPVTGVTAAAGKWCEFTATATGRYAFKFTSENCSIDRYSKLNSNTPVTPTRTDEKAYYMAKGETYYFYVSTTQTEAQSASIKVTTVDPEAAAIQLSSEAKKITMPDGGYVWYSYKAEANGYYRFNATPAEGGTVSVIYVKNKSNNFGNFELSSDREMEKGDRILLGFTGTKDASLNVSVTPQTVKDITVGTNDGIELPAAADGLARFKLKVYVPGMYTIRVVPGEAADGFTGISQTGLSNTSVSNKGIFAYNYYTEDQAFTLTATGAKATQPIKIIVERVFAKDNDFPAGLKLENVEIPANGSVFKKLVVPTDGIYTITTGENPSKVTISQLKQTGNNYTVENYSIESVGSDEKLLTFTANKEVYLRIDNNDATKDVTIAAVTVKKITATELQVGAGKQPVVVPKGAAEKCTFIVPETGLYTLKAELPEGTTGSISIDGVKNIDDLSLSGLTGTFNATEGKAGYFELSMSPAVADNVTVNITIERVFTDANTLTPKNPSKTITVPYGTVAYVRYLSESGGLYKIVASGESADNIRIDMLGSERTTVIRTDVNGQYLASSGSMYYAVVNTDPDEKDVTVTLSVESMSVSLPPEGTSAQYEYTADQNGVYRIGFTPSRGDDNYYYIYLYDEVNSYIGEVYCDTYDIVLAAGEKIYISIKNDSDESTLDGKVTVEMNRRADELKLGTNPVKDIDGVNDYRFTATFVAEKAGYYMFKDDYDNFDYTASSGANEYSVNNKQLYCSKGATVTVTIQCYYAHNFIILPVEELTLNVTQTVDINKGFSQLFRADVVEGAQYELLIELEKHRFSGNIYRYHENYNWIEGKYFGYNDYRYTFTPDTSERAIIELKNYGSDDTVRVTLRKATIVEVYRSPKPVTCPAGEYIYTPWKVKESGTYIFSSSLTSGDPKAWLYYADDNDMPIGTELASDDDGGGGIDFMLSYNLNEGDHVVLQSRHYSGSQDATYTIIITKITYD